MLANLEFRALMLLCPFWAGGCSLFVPGSSHPDPTPTAKSFLADHCPPPLAEHAELYRSDVLDTVKPNYVTVPSASGGREVRMLGATIHLRPVAGMSAAQIEKVLSCHSAQRVLGKVPEIPSDPYYLPNAWVTITVASDATGYLVQVQADNAEQGQRVLSRARAFRTGVAPRLP